MFFHRQRVVAATFYRGIVTHHHAFLAINTADTGNHTGGRYVFAVHLMGRQLADFEKRAAGIEQQLNALAHRQFAACGMALHRHVTTAFGDAGDFGFQVGHQRLHLFTVGGKLRTAAVEPGLDMRHQLCS